MNWLMGLLLLATAISIYVLWIRPALKAQPTFAEFYAQEESFWSAFRLKAAGIKGKVTTGVIFLAGIVTSLYDQIAPLALQTGVDITSLTDKIPAKAWPFILMGAVGLLQYFRRLSDKRAAANAQALEAAAAEK